MNEVVDGVEENLPALHRYAMALTRDAANADDLVQECVARALAKSHLFKPNTNLRAWLFTILHNLHVSEHRRASRMPEPADPDTVLSNLSVKAPQHSHVMVGAVREGMNLVPREQLSVLLLVGVEGLSYQEVADRMDLPVGTVKSRCFRARETLLEVLGEKRPALLSAAA